MSLAVSQGQSQPPEPARTTCLSCFLTAPLATHSSTWARHPCLTCVCVCVKVAQSCPNLCDPIIYTVHGILQARILEWVAFPFSRGSSQPRDQTQVSHIAGGFSTS